MEKVCRNCRNCGDDSIGDMPCLYCWHNMEIVTEDMTCPSFVPLEYSCETCKYHDSFSWVCFNGDSPYVADFVNCGCDKYSRREEGNF